MRVVPMDAGVFEFFADVCIEFMNKRIIMGVDVREDRMIEVGGVILGCFEGLEIDFITHMRVMLIIDYNII